MIKRNLILGLGVLIVLLVLSVVRFSDIEEKINLMDIDEYTKYIKELIEK